jgi:serine/threonine protein kinase
LGDNPCVGRFARYELLDRIGEGGMAEVWAARGYRSDGSVRDLVVKRIAPGLAGDPDFQAMLLEEARMTARLQHPQIVQTVDWGRLDDTLFLAMERVVGMDGRGLLEKSRSRRTPIPPEVALLIVAEVLEALGYAHAQRDDVGNLLGIVHRDISPANVLLSARGEVKLADFGIARAKFRVSRTQVGQVRGKPRYMSPEQARGEELDARSDIFACGLLLYEFLTGEAAYPGGETIEEVIEGLQREVPVPSDRLPDLPAGIDSLVQGMCERHADARYQTAKDARTAIEGVSRRRGLWLDSARLADLVQAFTERTAIVPPNVTRVLHVDDVDEGESVRLTADPSPRSANIGPDTAERTRVHRDVDPPPPAEEDRTRVRADVPPPGLDGHRAPVTASYFDEMLEGSQTAAKITRPFAEEDEGTQKKPRRPRPSRPAAPASMRHEEAGDTARSVHAAGPSIPAPPWFMIPILVVVLAVLAVLFRNR